MIKVFVADSFHSNKIAKILTEVYGAGVEVFCDASYLPVDPSGIDTLCAMISENSAEKFQNNTTSEGVDLFFLSAKVILQKSISAKEMKLKHGKPDAKVVAISTMEEYLEDVLKGDYGVDYAHSKDEFVGSMDADDLSDEEKEKLLSYLPKQEA